MVLFWIETTSLKKWNDNEIYDTEIGGQILAVGPSDMKINNVFIKTIYICMHEVVFNLKF